MVRVSFRKVVPRCEDIEKGNTSNPASGSASRSDVSGAVNEDAQQIASANTSSDQHDTEGKRLTISKLYLAIWKLLSHHCWLRAATKYPVQVRKLDDFSEGYANLAAFKNSDEDFAVYRRFGYLQSRILLEKQDELRVLETELDELDKKDYRRTTRMLNRDYLMPRQALLLKIETVFMSYANVLETCQRLLTCNRPASSELQSVRHYLEGVRPVHEKEREYIQHTEDLITLRPGREHAFIDRGIEKCLHLFEGKVKFVQKLFADETTRMKASNPATQFYYNRRRINFCASLIILVVVLALLTIPIYILCKIMRNKGFANGVVIQDQTASCVGVLLVSTLLFSAVLCLFTRAKRHEVLGAAAAYCAVLVVFLGNIPLQK